MRSAVLIRTTALREVERAVARGAAGIKLHPRAKRFELGDPAVRRILAVACERRLPVIVHAARGIPSLGRDALKLARAYPRAPLILAPAIADLWWNTADQLALFALISPGRFCSPPTRHTIERSRPRRPCCALRSAPGSSAEQIAMTAGGQLARLACELPAGHPDAAVAKSVCDVLDRHAAHLATHPQRRSPRVHGVHLIFVAAAIARHPTCPSPASGMSTVPPQITLRETAFRLGHPDYAQTAVLDGLRRSDFARLDRGGHVYLDYTGGGLYAQSQLHEHMRLLESRVFGNPHSINPSSAASTELIERARAYALEFFNASPEEYVAIFTPNATGALRLVGEAYPFHRGDRFLLTFDNHNSVNGIREFARARGAETTYVPSVAPDLRVDENLLPRYLTDTIGDHHNLLAYPAQSNFSGVQHPLEWIEQAQSHGWDVLLDAAAFVPTNRLDLSRWHPDFVAISFYKMFGWPTGLGCLLARRDALTKLERPWFSGGTIVAAFVQREYYQSAPGTAHFEDGTVNYVNLPAVEIGLRFLDRIGIETIHTRVAALGAWLLDSLGTLKHTDSSPAAVIYGPRKWEQRGATIAFNFLRPDGSVVDERYVDRIASEHNISLRTGCFCNPGAGEVAFTISRETLLGGEFGEGMTLDDYVATLGLHSGGAIRASSGWLRT